MNSCIVRYSEIGLKGKNRIMFERKLINNIRSCLDRNKIKFTNIRKPHGRILISEVDDCKQLNCVFGISSFSKSVNVGFNMDEIKQKALDLVKDNIQGKSFYVSCQRLDKNFPVKSPDFARDVGSFIQYHTKAGVKLKNPDITVYAEIIDGDVYLFTEKIRGPGGLPVGVEGNVVVIIDDEASVLAALFMLKRGCDVFCVAKEKQRIDLLSKYAYGSKVELKILKSDKEIEDFAKEKHSKAIVVNDTLESIQEYDFTLPIYRPLSALNQKQIEDKLNEFRKRVC
jgi:thiamine biosynthesis protein ThiI